jgi:hypothetical protein
MEMSWEGVFSFSIKEATLLKAAKSAYNKS